jgi:hypothetical protein
MVDRTRVPVDSAIAKRLGWAPVGSHGVGDDLIVQVDLLTQDLAELAHLRIKHVRLQLNLVG